MSGGWAGGQLGDFMQVYLLREARGGGKVRGGTVLCVWGLFLLAAARGTFLLIRGPSGRDEDVQENRAGPGSNGELQCPGYSVGFGAMSDRFLLEWTAWGSRRPNLGAEGEHLCLHDLVFATSAISAS